MIERHRFNSKTLSSFFFYLLILLTAVMTLLFFSVTTSPLSKYCVGSDSAFFRLVGKGMKSGLLPYRDFFDMKGPYLFVIEYLCQMIQEGRLSIFLFQCINLFISLIFVERSLNLFSQSKVLKLFLIIPFLTQLALSLNGGNLTEEYSLIPITFSLYNGLKYFKDCDAGTYTHNPLIAFGYGVAFGIISLIRVTNAALICAVIFTILCVLIANRQHMNILQNAIMFILGVIATYLPILAFFAYHDLLSEMFYQVFLFGFTYATENSTLDNIREIFKSIYTITGLIVLLFPAAVSILNRKMPWYYRLLAITGTLITLFVCSMGFPYIHYFVLAAPLAIIGEVVFMGSFSAEKSGLRKKLSTAICAFTMVVLLLITARSCNMYLDEIMRDCYDPFLTEEIEIAGVIPENERESVFAYDIEPAWYIVSEIMPYGRYVAWQEHYIELSPKVEEDIFTLFRDDPPLRIVIKRDQSINSTSIANIFNRNYILEYSSKSLEIYKLKDAVA